MKIELNEKTVDLTDQFLGAFLGSFVSEGNLYSPYSIKITNSNIAYLNCAIDCITKVLGKDAVTSLPPTQEHKDAQEGFHKYFRSVVGKLLMEGYGIKAGKRILNNQGLPSFINRNIITPSETEHIKKWLISYLQMRYSGDGHVRNDESTSKNGRVINTRSVILTKNNALKLGEKIIKSIELHYEYKKKVKEYPIELKDELKCLAKSADSYPLELIELKDALYRFFKIYSRLDCHGLRSIYRDRKRGLIIVSCVYRLVISKKDDIERFEREINFAPFDIINREKLKNVLCSYN